MDMRRGANDHLQPVGGQATRRPRPVAAHA